MSSKVKHLEFIQGVVNRLATNSFRIKGWAVILVSALLALLITQTRADLAWIGFVPVLVFWGLTAISYGRRGCSGTSTTMSVCSSKIRSTTR